MRFTALAFLLILVAPALVADVGAANASARPGREGVWTWTQPNLLVQGQVVTVRPTMVMSTERGYLEIGPVYENTPDWTIDLPSALVGCRGDRPTYAPKVDGTIMAEVVLAGSCLLKQSNNAYRPDWQASLVTANGPATVRLGPMRGEGVF